MDYQLTDNEMVQAVYDFLQASPQMKRQYRPSIGMEHRAIASEQRKKLLVHIKSRCAGRTHLDTFGRRNIAVVRRHDCPECMVELLKAHGIEP